ncbi:hypothetical protein EDB86DRAFT_2833703 [Lactarius hatsudake]|nr:hypothetical protein EDB86DRAFT_2833703 [Lactarius hatsudake]
MPHGVRHKRRRFPQRSAAAAAKDEVSEVAALVGRAKRVYDGVIGPQSRPRLQDMPALCEVLVKERRAIAAFGRFAGGTAAARIRDVFGPRVLGVGHGPIGERTIWSDVDFDVEITTVLPSLTESAAVWDPGYYSFVLYRAFRHLLTQRTSVLFQRFGASSYLLPEVFQIRDMSSTPERSCVALPLYSKTLIRRSTSGNTTSDERLECPAGSIGIPETWLAPSSLFWWRRGPTTIRDVEIGHGSGPSMAMAKSEAALRALQHLKTFGI